MRRRSRFSYRGRSGYSQPEYVQKKEIVLKRSTTCGGLKNKRTADSGGCGGSIPAGETIVQLKLKKRYRAPCGSCHQTPVARRRYHAACCPTDLNKAMGFDPNARPNTMYRCLRCNHTQPTPFIKHCPACGNDPNTLSASSGTVPPPPKPKSASDLTLEAFVKLEAALIAQVRERKKVMTPELDSEFKKFQGIKQRILRPGTPGEEAAATLVGMQRLVKMVLS